MCKIEIWFWLSLLRSVNGSVFAKTYPMWPWHIYVGCQCSTWCVCVCVCVYWSECARLQHTVSSCDHLCRLSNCEGEHHFQSGPNYYIWYVIYLTAIGLTPGGSSTVHIYTQTVQLGWHPVAAVQYTFTHKQYTEQHNETEWRERKIHNNKRTHNLIIEIHTLTIIYNITIITSNNNKNK
jgi:hypothetical protein